MFCTPGPKRDFDAVFATLIELRASALVIAVDFYFTCGENSSPAWLFATECLRCTNIATSPRPEA